MEEQEKTSGKVLVESLREQFKRIIPQKTLRVLLSAVTIVLLVGLLIGIVSGCLAIARCGTGRTVEAGAEPVANVKGSSKTTSTPEERIAQTRLVRSVMAGIPRWTNSPLMMTTMGV